MFFLRRRSQECAQRFPAQPGFSRMVYVSARRNLRTVTCIRGRMFRRATQPRLWSMTSQALRLNFRPVDRFDHVIQQHQIRPRPYQRQARNALSIE